MAVETSLIDKVLTVLETRELRSLKWGYVDGALSEAEVRALVAQALSCAEGDPAVAEMLQELYRRRLLFRFRWPDGSYRYRTRFAEGVRLLTRLKQIFPGRSWATSPDLVSDYRIHAGPRAFPRRDVPKADVLARLRALEEWTPEYEAAMDALIPDDRKLAAFQVRAAEAVLRRDPHGHGVVVCAGTGSGKTLAFYYPALTEIATLVRKDEYWTKAVAIYPRVELLKDQVQEVFEQARRLDALLLSQGRRPLRIGVLFASTPQAPNEQSLKRAGWKEQYGGYVCPFLRCECGGVFVWKRKDLDPESARLQCSNSSCARTVSNEVLALTREDLVQRPPDILFTTTETLNIRLSDTKMRPVLGVAERRVRLVLLDEIHTYTGVTGAQTAHALRRWRRLLPPDVRFVGLSATLEDAREFLASLVGIRQDRVFETSPMPEELERASFEYQLILRSNPAAKTQLLSTTIQTTFLIARLLDGGLQPGRPQYSDGFYGQRTFVFTDDLDVTNRLYDYLRDAEGYNVVTGKPDPNKLPLAAARARSLPHASERMWAGQNWAAVEWISGGLDHKLRVSRTTSQDVGVDAASEVVVATSALEVGFDDNRVGAVVQHKAPLDMASFLQRKGRAGRTRLMRPWMITVLSDFGRDRLAFQDYDRLFLPVLRKQTLPIRNRHVLRMQAVLTLIDWLAEQVQPNNGGVWMWRALSRPAAPGTPDHKLQQQVCDILFRLLDGDAYLCEKLKRVLKTVLEVQDEELEAILWEPPRSLMLDAIPALLRRLQTGWKLHPALQPADGEELLDHVAPGPAYHPLPDFVPANLFSPLNVPDVIVYVPEDKGKWRTETMGIVHALNHLVPGRVTRRFAFQRGYLNHWVPVPIDKGDQRHYELHVRKYTRELEAVGTLSVSDEGDEQTVTLYRPRAIALEIADSRVRPTSNAVLVWRFEVLPPEDGVAAVVDTDSRFGGVFRAGEFFLHQFRAPVTVRRFSLEAKARIVVQSPGNPQRVDRRSVTTRFVDDAGLAAVGFEHDVDAFRLQIELPPAVELVKRVAEAPTRPSWLVAYFRHLVDEAAFPEDVNDIERDWFFRVYFSAMVFMCAEENLDVAAAVRRLGEEKPRDRFTRAVDALLLIDSEELSELDVEEGPGSEKYRQSRDDFVDRMLSPEVWRELQNCAEEWVNPDSARLGAWLSDRLAESLAEASLQAFQRLAPLHVVPESLLVDFMSADTAGRAAWEVWITEATTGGVGALEEIARQVVENPRDFFSALDAALAPSDYELVSVGLLRFLELVETVPEVAEAVSQVRAQDDHESHERAFAALRTLLARHGLAVDDTMAVSLHQRVLRPGTGPESDRLLLDLYRYWMALEERLGIAVDLRTFAFLAVHVPLFRGRIQQLFAEITGENLPPSKCAAALTGLLWAKPNEYRDHVLSSYNPFRRTGWTDPGLIRELLMVDRVETVVYGETGWRERVDQVLSKDAVVRIRASRAQEAEFQRALVRLLAEPVMFQELEFYPNLTRLERDAEGTEATLAIKEMV